MKRDAILNEIYEPSKTENGKQNAKQENDCQ